MDIESPRDVPSSTLNKQRPTTRPVSSKNKESLKSVAQVIEEEEAARVQKQTYKNLVKKMGYDNYVAKDYGMGSRLRDIKPESPPHYRANKSQEKWNPQSYRESRLMSAE